MVVEQIEFLEGILGYSHVQIGGAGWPADVKSKLQMSEVRDLVTTYFKGVDEENLDLILHTLHPDCVFSVETHNVCLTGHTEITAMFLRLWSNHASVLHNQFHFVEGNSEREIAVHE